LAESDRGPIIGHHPNAREEVEEQGHTDHRCLRITAKAVGFALSTIVAPVMCRRYGLPIPQRCGVLFASVLVLNLTEALPLYCLSLFVPVMGTLCGVLGEKRGIPETATLLVSNFFTNVSFLVLGALVTNGIFAKCGIDQRMIRWLLLKVPIESGLFLLLLMVGTTAVASVLYSASLMLFSSLRVFLYQDADIASVPIPVAKRILLGVAFASNAGSTWLPISSPVNLVAMGLLGSFDKRLTSTEWAAFAVPVATITVIGSWAALMVCFPTSVVQEDKDEKRPAVRAPEARKATFTDAELYESLPVEAQSHDPVTPVQMLFMALAFVAVLLITAFPPELERLIGHPAILSLCVVVVVFGSGFMTREEFLQLDWDLLSIVGGTNVMAFLVRDTGLGAILSEVIVNHPYFEYLRFLSLLVLLVCGTLSVSTLLGHTMSGVILLPLIIAVGVKVQAAQTVALICTVAVPFGMGFSHSSFDNVAALTTSMNLGKEDAVLKRRDFNRAGMLTTIWGAFVLLSVGPWVGEQMFGPPPPLVVAEISDTPEELKPRVVKESLPAEVEQVEWEKGQLANWNEFLKRPDKKAFAVGTLRGMQTRGWAATWNHPTQEGANRAAMDHCEQLSERCRLIYPPEQGLDMQGLPKPADMQGLPKPPVTQ
jgi:di/tricarboxylate transporter